MSDIIEILKLAKEVVASFVTRKHDAAEAAWAPVIVALDKLSDLPTLHVRAIDEVTAPLLSAEDLVETSRRYTLLANNPDFPQGYGAIRGVLEATQKLKAFQGKDIQDHVERVLDQLSKFQYGAFRLDWDSYQIADTLARAAKLVESLNEHDASQLRELGASFIDSYTELLKEPVDSGLDAPTSVPELVALLQSWCISWQRYVQRTLYGGRGLNYEISQLKMKKDS